MYVDRDGYCAEPLTFTLCAAGLSAVITWEGSVIHEEITQGSSFPQAASNPVHVARGAAVGGIVLTGGVLAIEGASVAAAVQADGWIVGSLASLPQATATVGSILVPEAGAFVGGSRFIKNAAAAGSAGPATPAASAGQAFAAEARVAQAMAGAKPAATVAPAQPKTATVTPRNAVLTAEGGGIQRDTVTPIVGRTVAPKSETAPLAFKRVEGKSVRATDYPTRVRQPTKTRLEKAAADENGVMHCQNPDCAVPGGRVMAPGMGSPEHIPKLVESHNNEGYNMKQSERNDLFNETAKELHCRNCQADQGGSTTDRYRRDVGPDYEPRPSRKSKPGNGDVEKL